MYLAKIDSNCNVLLFIDSENLRNDEEKEIMEKFLSQEKPWYYDEDNNYYTEATIFINNLMIESGIYSSRDIDPTEYIAWRPNSLIKEFAISQWIKKEGN